VVRVVLVETSTSLTSTPGIAAFCWSVTIPVTVLVEVACDQAGVAPRLSNTPRQTASSPVKSRELPLDFILPPVS